MAVRVSFPEIYRVPTNLIAGLRWMTFPAKNTWFARVRIRVLEKGGVSHVVKRKEGDSLVQIGLVSRTDNVFGSFSAAQLLALAHPEDTFLAIIPVISNADNQRFWLVGVDAGQIIPQTDVIGSADEINAVKADVSWGFDGIPVLAPGFMDVFGASDNIAEDFFFDPAIISSIKPIRRYTAKSQVAASILIFGAYYGYSSYTDYVDRTQALQLQSQKRELSKAQIKTLEELKAEALEKEWAMIQRMLSGPGLGSVSDVVISHFGDLPAVIPGWRPVAGIYSPRETESDMTLRADEMAFTFTRSGGRVATLSDYFPEGQYSIVYSPDTTKAVVRRRLDLGSISVPTKDIFDPDGNRRLTLVDWLSAQPLSVSVGTSERVVRPEELKSAAIAPDKFFVTDIRKYALTLSGKGLSHLASIASVIGETGPALQMRSLVVRYDADYSWTFKADYYE